MAEQEAEKEENQEVEKEENITTKPKEEVIVVDDDIQDTTVDYKDKYNNLLLTTSLKASKAFQSLDLPEGMALDYFKKYFTVSEAKGSTVITGEYADAKLIDKDKNPVSVDDAVRYIISKNKDFKSALPKKTPGYKGTLKINTKTIKNMSVSEKLAYRKQVGSATYRSLLAKQG